MSCEHCDPGSLRGTAAFASEIDYVAERSRIEELITSGEACAVETNGWTLDFACQICGQRWQLSTPDQAYRGYLKPIHELHSALRS